MPKHPSRWKTGREISQRDFLKGTAMVVGGAAVTGLAVLLSACAPKEETVVASPGANEIWANDRGFKPSTITVPVGTRVTWVSKTGDTHTVTSSDGLFKGILEPFGSFSYTFTERGTFSYYCEIWGIEGMVGTVVVQ